MSGIRDRVAVIGVGCTKFGDLYDMTYEDQVCEAAFEAYADAGIDPRAIDGFASYSNDRNDPSRLAAALGIPDLRFSNMQWGGGVGGGSAAVGNAAAAIAAGYAHCVVVVRARLVHLPRERPCLTPRTVRGPLDDPEVVVAARELLPRHVAT